MQLCSIDTIKETLTIHLVVSPIPGRKLVQNFQNKIYIKVGKTSKILEGG